MTAGEPTLESSRLTRRIGLLLIVAAVAAAGYGGYRHFASVEKPPVPAEPDIRPDPPEPDPRLTYPTPYRNVKPGVAYVGDEACAVCHKEICTTYHQHPMGRSAELVTPATMTEKFPFSGKAEFQAGPFTLAAEKTAAGLRHRLRLTESTDRIEADLPVSVAIGSGTRGKSYLTVRNGSVWQTPVSWFGPDEKWDLSPGFRIGHSILRPIAAPCLYCHTNSVEPIAGRRNQYREPVFPKQLSIGCERCHGPGDLHVNERGLNPTITGPDTSIVNPKHLSPALQRAVCEQCHLQGQDRVTRRGRELFEYRPGLPFELFASVFVRHPDIAAANKSVGQFEQMESSVCFTKSGGRMTCTSCHDPHAAATPATRDALYRKQCLTCHDGPGKTPCNAPAAERQTKADSCIACHMPKAASSNITHASVTNHRVPRRAETAAPATKTLPYGTIPLVRFHAGRDLSPDELDRDLGIALSRYGKMLSGGEIAQRGDPKAMAVGKLKAATARRPGDAAAWEALADARNERTESSDKLKAAKTAAALAPDSESAVIALTAAATSANELGLAMETATRWATIAPESYEPYTARAFIRMKSGDWLEAEADCREALKRHPLHAETHLYLAICLHKRGLAAEAGQAARTASDLEADPREKAGLMDWYRRATR